MQLKRLAVMAIINIILSTIAANVIKEQHTTDVSDIIGQINREGKLDINILINYDKMLNNSETYQQFLKATQAKEPAKIIITDPVLYNVTALYRKFSDQCLTVAWITEENLLHTLKSVDQLLWKLHFKDILLVYHGPAPDFYKLFERCWKYGFISVLLWCDNRLYTYYPYPKIKVVPIYNITTYRDKSHLDNFQGYEMVLPALQFPPVCFSYLNKRGELLRVGYFYKWIEIFLKHHNATIKHNFYDVWQANVSFTAIKKAFMAMNFSFVPGELPANDDYASSVVLIVTRHVLIVPSSMEISSKLYILKPFNLELWCCIILCGFLFLVLMIFVNVLYVRQIHVAQAFLQTIKIILFLSVFIKPVRTLFMYYLCLLFLFTGLFLTNFFSSSLSSLFTAKAYEPEYQQLEDLKRNDLLIFQHFADVELLMQMDIPQFLKQRLRSGNNNDFRNKRQSLDMSYMYSGQENLIDFVLFQQSFMKKPKAKKLREPLRYKPFFVVLPHRSPVIDQFNRYLHYIRENGILKKILDDTNWHGVFSGNLKIHMDDDMEKPLTIQYFQYAFLLWTCGLLCAFVWFLIECFHRHIVSLMTNVINKIVK